MINKSQIEPTRSGAIASFPDATALRNGFNNVAVLLPSLDANEFRQRHGIDAQVPNVLYLALRLFDEQDDMKNEQWREVSLSLVNERKPIITSQCVCRLTFLISRKQGTIPLVFHTSRAGRCLARRGGYS